MTDFRLANSTRRVFMSFITDFRLANSTRRVFHEFYLEINTMYENVFRHERNLAMSSI